MLLYTGNGLALQTCMHKNAHSYCLSSIKHLDEVRYSNPFISQKGALKALFQTVWFIFDFLLHVFFFFDDDDRVHPALVCGCAVSWPRLKPWERWVQITKEIQTVRNPSIESVEKGTLSLFCASPRVSARNTMSYEPNMRSWGTASTSGGRANDSHIGETCCRSYSRRLLPRKLDFFLIEQNQEQNSMPLTHSMNRFLSKCPLP